jgi:hypothetical protein
MSYILSYFILIVMSVSFLLFILNVLSGCRKRVTCWWSTTRCCAGAMVGRGAGRGESRCASSSPWCAWPRPWPRCTAAARSRHNTCTRPTGTYIHSLEMGRMFGLKRTESNIRPNHSVQFHAINKFVHASAQKLPYNDIHIRQRKIKSPKRFN